MVRLLLASVQVYGQEAYQSLLLSYIPLDLKAQLRISAEETRQKAE